MTIKQLILLGYPAPKAHGSFLVGACLSKAPEETTAARILISREIRSCFARQWGYCKHRLRIVYRLQHPAIGCKLIAPFLFWRNFETPWATTSLMWKVSSMEVKAIFSSVPSTPFSGNVNLDGNNLIPSEQKRARPLYSSWAFASCNPHLAV